MYLTDFTNLPTVAVVLQQDVVLPQAPNLLQAGLFTKWGGVTSEVIDGGSSLSNKQLNLILKMGWKVMNPCLPVLLGWYLGRFGW